MTDVQQKKGTVLVVDDIPDNIDILKGVLSEEFVVKAVTSGEKALSVAESIQPDVILLDIMMPGMDGYEVCCRLKQMEATREIPVIFVTALSEITNEEKGFEVGCVDYLTKPINPSLALARVRTHTALRRARLELQEWNSNLKRKVISNATMIREKNEELREVIESTDNSTSTLISSFSNMLDIVDHHQFTHAKIVSKLACEAAKRLSLDFRTIRDISLAALLHDIGKLGMGKLIHQNPFDMTESEQVEYRQHPLRSQFVLEHLAPLQNVALMIRHHHEAYNGTGFPNGLRGDAIPLGAQLIGIADFIDNAAQSIKEDQAEYAMKKISLCSGVLFNAALIPLFYSVARTVYYRGQRKAEMLLDVEVPPSELMPGMQVTRDVVTGSGMMLAEKGTELEAGAIALIRRYHKSDASECGIFVSLASPV